MQDCLCLHLLYGMLAMAPREYGIYRMSRPRKKLKGWQRELKRKNK